MSKVLYIQSSPRGKRSKSIAVTDAFLEVYRQSHPADEIETLNLFEADLISFDGLAVQAKYTILHGQQHSAEELAAWKAVEELAGQFMSADKFVLAVPMWNFGIPYRLKQYIDILVQPTYTFSYSPEEGYKGLVVGKPAFIAYARGGEYNSPEAQPLDLQKPYLELILGFIGFEDISSVTVEPTIMAGPDIAAQKLTEALEKAKAIAEAF